MPLWADLGATIASELGDYTAAGALDAISAFEHEYGRPKLVERLTESLFISDSTPGTAHRAFCSLPFDVVCTTNFDFLLERQYEIGRRPCTPLVDEDQLSINTRDSGVLLLKLHGDLRHPIRLVATEADYDRFLDKFPMLATYLANLLITRTAVLIGYSLDDPDFRQIWQVVGERLGRSRRLAYSIAVGAKPSEISRFDRRGVKVINLPRGKSDYGDVLASAFAELRDFWRAAVIPSSQIKEEQSLGELLLPPDAQTRLCFFAVPLTLLSFYRDRVFPIARECGFVPVTADDVVSPGDTILPKIDALIGRALLMVVDASSESTHAEYRLALTRLHPSRLLLIFPAMPTVEPDLDGAQALLRPDVTESSPEPFLDRVQNWFRTKAELLRPAVLGEPARLFHAGEYRASVISAISLLESVLRRKAAIPVSHHSRAVSLRDVVEHANRQELLGTTPVDSVLEWLKIRNEVVHRNATVSKTKAEEIVNGVQTIALPHF